jgi:hypothetical protein
MRFEIKEVLLELIFSILQLAALSNSKSFLLCSNTTSNKFGWLVTWKWEWTFVGME